MTLFETIVDELSGKEFTKKDLQQIQGRRRAVPRHLKAGWPILLPSSAAPPPPAVKFIEEDITPAPPLADAIKDYRCGGSGGVYAVWQ